MLFRGAIVERAKLKGIVVTFDGGFEGMAGEGEGKPARDLTALTDGRSDMCAPFGLEDACAASLLEFLRFGEELPAGLACEKLSRVSSDGMACGEWMTVALRPTVRGMSPGRQVTGKAHVKSSA